MKRPLRSLLPVALLSLMPLGVAGCPAPEPPTTPASIPKSEERARAALEKAKKKDDPEALLAVYHEFKDFPSGTKALNLGVRKLFEQAIDAANNCDEMAAKTLMARANPYALDFPAINEAYDETYESVAREKKRCMITRLDADLKKAEAEWDWPRAFNRVGSEREVDGAVLSKRRLELTEHYNAWLDGIVKKILEQKSVAKAVGDKHEKFEASVDPDQFPPEIAEVLKKRTGAIAGMRVVYEKLEEGAIIDPPASYWTFGSVKAHKTDYPSDVALTLPNGVPFTAVARGKVGGVMMLMAGPTKGSLEERLAGRQLLIPESSARTFNTGVALPEELVGAKVLAPIAIGSDTLTPSTVLSDTGGTVAVSALVGGGRKSAGPKMNTKKSELRGLALAAGQKVSVYAGGAWKPGEITDVPDGDHVMVRVNGFEVLFGLGDIRIKRSELPALPKE